MNPNKYFYDIAKWDYPYFDYRVNDVSDIDTSNWFESDAIHRVFLNKDISIDICVIGSKFFKDLKSYLVCFSGAVPGDRSIKPAPVFSGVTVATDLKMPVISISDPTLLYSDEIYLSWYAGNKDYPNLVQIIADLIDLISVKFQKKAILFGGSGGGFAGLAVAQHTVEPVDVCVANPQISIKDYIRRYVTNYLVTAYNIDAGKFDKELVNDVDVEDSLEQYVKHHDVKRGRFNKKSKIIYLQNDSDWHVEEHAIPFLKKYTIKKIGNRTFLNSNENMAFYLGKWGAGHAPIPKDILYKALTHLANNDSLDLTLKTLDELNTSHPSPPQIAEILKLRDGSINIDDDTPHLNLTIDRPVRLYRNSTIGERVFVIELLLASDEKVKNKELLFSIDKIDGLHDEDMVNLGYAKSNRSDIGYFKYIQTRPHEVYKTKVSFILPNGCDFLCLKIMSFNPNGKTIIMDTKLLS